MDKKNNNEQTDHDDIMLDSEYLHQSSAIISESLHKGHDVLQLDNGDIVTTGVKVIVTRYHWNEKTGKMEKLSAKERKELEDNKK